MKRRLAAILMADVVGFSRMMQADEAGTLRRLSQRRAQVLDTVVRTHNGRVIKLMGDGVLIEFASAVSAVEAALDLQVGFKKANSENAKEPQITLRIGINLGDVIGQGKDVFGDSVNIAARLETLAEPGTVCISGKVYAEIAGKVAAEIDDIGPQEVKNITGAVHAYILRPAGVDHATPAPVSTKGTYPALPRRPSIAVLPFQNMSTDAEQEYFADGMVEDIITELSRDKSLFVIARNSSFTYKGKAVNITLVGRELGVRYVLEGSIRRAGNRVRITAQLIDAPSGAHVWADRFDGDMEDVFDLQDQITQRVVGEIAPRLERAEMERVRNNPTDSLDAYDHYLRGLAGFHQFESDANVRALAHFNQAVSLDPGFAPAIGMAARCYGQRVGFGWISDLRTEQKEALRLANEAVHIGNDDASVLANAGFTMVLFRQTQQAESILERAVLLNPNLFIAYQVLALAKVLTGDVPTAREAAQSALRLSPQDSQLFGTYAVLAIASYFDHDLDAAENFARRSLDYRSNFKTAVAVRAACAARQNDSKTARQYMDILLAMAPELTDATLDSWLYFTDDTHRSFWHEGLARAGLPA